MLTRTRLPVAIDYAAHEAQIQAYLRQSPDTAHVLHDVREGDPGRRERGLNALLTLASSADPPARDAGRRALTLLILQGAAPKGAHQSLKHAIRDSLRAWKLPANSPLAKGIATQVDAFNVAQKAEAQEAHALAATDPRRAQLVASLLVPKARARAPEISSAPGEKPSREVGQVGPAPAPPPSAAFAAAPALALAEQVGNKAANLVHYEALAELPRLGVQVPKFMGFAHQQVWAHLMRHAPAVQPLWDRFVAQVGGAKELPPVAHQTLHELRQEIGRCFDSHPFEPAAPWLSRHRDHTLMVRSSGREDSEALANAGGNESVAHVAAVAAPVSQAMGRVVASYFSDKSIHQRLLAGDDIAAKPFVPVLLQVMVGEGHNDPTPPSSGVMFTREAEGRTPGVVHIQAAFGHNEGVVTGQVAVDNYFCRNGHTHAVIAHKPQRLRAEADGPVRVDNAPDLRRVAALSPQVIARLTALATCLESKSGGHPLDVEFTYDAGKDVIYLVQVRPLVEPPTPPPSYLDLAALGDAPRLHGTVIGSAGGQVRTLETAAHALIHDSLEGALAAYLAAPNRQSVRAVLVRHMAPATSHEATTFRGMNLPVVQCPTPEKAQQWLQEPHARVWVDTQTGLLADGRACPPAIAQGWRAHPIPNRLSLGAGGVTVDRHQTHALLQALLAGGWPQTAVPAEPQATLTALLAACTPAHEEALLARVHVPGNRLVRLLEVAENDGDKTRALGAMAHLFRHAVAAATRLHRRDASFDGPAGDMLGQLVQDMSAVLDSRQAEDTAIVQRYALRWLRAVLTQPQREDAHGTESLITLLARGSDYAVARQRAGGVGSAQQAELLPFLAEYARLEQLAQSPEVAQSWRTFTRFIAQSGNHRANQALAALIVQAQAYGTTPFWLNTAFVQAWAAAGAHGKGAKQAASCLLALQAAGRDPSAQAALEVAQASRSVAQTWRQRTGDWGQPQRFEATLQAFERDFVPHGHALLAALHSPSQLAKIAVYSALREHIEAFDLQVKGLTGSPLYAGAAALELKVQRFARLLQPYHALSRGLAQAVLPEDARPNEPVSRVLAALDARLAALQTKTGVEQLRPSGEFNVSSALLTAAGAFDRFAPRTLEDFFTLTHQNALGTVAYGLTQAGVNTEFLHPTAQALCRAFEQTILPVDSNADPARMRLVGMQFNPPEMMVQYNMPLRGHGAGVTLRTEVGDAGTLRKLIVEVDVFSQNRFVDNATEVPLLLMAAHAEVTGQAMSIKRRSGNSAQLRWDLPPAEGEAWARKFPQMLQAVGTTLYPERVTGYHGLAQQGALLQQLLDLPAASFDPERLSQAFFAKFPHELDSWWYEVTTPEARLVMSRAICDAHEGLSVYTQLEALQILRSSALPADKLLGRQATQKILGYDTPDHKLVHELAVSFGVPAAEISLAVDRLFEQVQDEARSDTVSQTAVEAILHLDPSRTEALRSVLLGGIGPAQPRLEEAPALAAARRISLEAAQTQLRRGAYDFAPIRAGNVAGLARLCGATPTQLNARFQQLMTAETDDEGRGRWAEPMRRNGLAEFAPSAPPSVRLRRLPRR